MTSLRAGLVLIGAGAALLFAFWSGALSLVLDELTGKVAA